jgi:hypothetical protein
MTRVLQLCIMYNGATRSPHTSWGIVGLTDTDRSAGCSGVRRARSTTPPSD